MPRFTDSWVVNNTMFIYLQEGVACICCAPQSFNLFSPEKEPIEAMIRSLDDFTDDEKEAEIRAMKTSPWDEDMTRQIWGDRGLLRWRMKKEIGRYRSFFEGIVRDSNCASAHQISVVEKLHHFCVNSMTAQELNNLFQLSREELLDILKTKYKICSFYSVVFSTVVEQLEHFELTEIGADASKHHDNISESDFEKDLKFSKRNCRFCMDIVDMDKGDECRINDVLLRRFLNRMVNLADPTLLLCSSPSEENYSGSKNPTFRSDRRVIRLIIARCWADKLMNRYKEVRIKNNIEVS